MKKIILLALTLIILAACSPTPKVELAGEWKLVSYGDAVHPTAALPDVDTSIKFDNGQLSGNVGCNSFGGSYKIKGDRITFGPMMSTLMFCELVSIQEHDVLAVLSDGADLKIQLSGNTLTLTSADGLSVVNLARK